MNEYAVRRLALILSVQAVIEAMKVANLERESRDESHIMLGIFKKLPTD